MLAALGALPQERGLERVDVPFVRTPRNGPAFAFLDGVGAPFKRTHDSLTFELPAELVAALTYFPAEGAGGSMEVRPSRLR